MTERYRFEPTGRGFWPFCVVAGDGTRELFIGHRKSCERVAAELTTAFRDGEFVGKRDYDALHAEAEALRAENGRLKRTVEEGMPRLMQQGYEMRAELEAAQRGIREVVELIDCISRHPANRIPALDQARAALVKALTATPAPEVRHALSAENQRVVPPGPIIAPPHPLDKPSLLKDCNVTYSNSSRPLAEQGERQEAAGWLIDWPDNPGLGLYFSSVPDANARSRPLYTTPQPGPDVRGLVEALEGVVKRCSRSGYVGVDGQYLKVINAALAAHRQAQQSASK